MTAGFDNGKGLIIRPIKIEDAVFLNSIRLAPGVTEHIYALPSERQSSAENFIKNLSDHHHVFVAEIREGDALRVIGVGSIQIEQRFRLRHSAFLGIMVHPDFQHKGVGRNLMATLLDLADRWLRLVRIELEVFPENERAIELYKSFGFVEEGLCKYASVKDGQYKDVLLMARYTHYTT